MPNVITSLEIQKKNKERVNVFLDGAYAFSLTLDAALALKRGQELSPAEIETLRQADEAAVAYQRALGYLSMRPRSQAEVTQYLRNKEYDPALIDQVIERLQRAGYLDEAAFAQFWRESRERFRPRSARAMRYELQQKGVDKAVIDEALSGVDEEAAAWALIEPKLARWQALSKEEFEHKVLSLLARRGFAFDLARRVCRRAWQTVDQPDSLDDP
jgi:regulatory protein